MKLKNYKSIHFIGIGGISMSGLSEILLNQGYRISGSDANSSKLTDLLRNKGINVYIGHDEKNISADVDLIVYTAAISSDNVELLYAKNNNIEAIERSVLLGLMMQDYSYSLCIAGTHGKTTTSSMTTEVFLAAEKNPTVSIGGILSSINGNYRIGGNEYFIVESCEYCDSFLKFLPYSAIILNIDRDHTDYFETLEDSYTSFKNFASLLPKDGVLVINAEIPDINKITANLSCNIILYGSDNNCLWHPRNVIYNEFGHAEYDAYKADEFVAHIKLSVAGFHNVLNSLAVFALSDFHGLKKEDIIKGLAAFKGTERRFEFKGMLKGAKIIDDYAHHPTEILATLNSARANKINKLTCVFQPHTYSRTKSLLNEFAECFDQADNIIVLDIYAARENNPGDIHSKDLVAKLEERGKKAVYVDSFESAKDFILSTLEENDMLITIGAGTVYLLGNELLSQ